MPYFLSRISLLEHLPSIRWLFFASAAGLDSEEKRTFQGHALTLVIESSICHWHSFPTLIFTLKEWAQNRAYTLAVLCAEVPVASSASRHEGNLSTGVHA